MAASSEFENHKDVIQNIDIWQPLIVESIASFLPHNVVACTLRLVNKATHSQFHTCSRVDLRMPCPEHAFAVRFGAAGALKSLSFEQRRTFLIRTAASGSIPNLKVAFRATAATLTDEALDPDALAPGQLCPWLEGKGCWWLSEVLAGAAGAGQREMCEWLLASGCPCIIDALYSAVRGGHLGLMDWMLHQRPDLRAEVKLPELMEAAAEGCDLAALQQLYGEWVHEQGGQQQQPVETAFSRRQQAEVLAAAAGSPSPDWRAKVELLEGLGFLCKSGPAPYRAILSLPNAVERLTWLSSRGYAVGGSDLLVDAAFIGNAAAVEYLLGEAGATEEQERLAMCEEAAREGHLSVLQTLHTRGYLTPGPDHGSGSRQVIRLGLKAAVGHGHVAVATWLVDTFGVTGAELQEVMDDGAAPGSIQMAEWLQGRGCHWSTAHWVTEAAAGVGCEELLELAAAGLELQPGEDALWEAYWYAVLRWDIATLRCLHRLGVPMTEGHSVYDAAHMHDGDGKRSLPVLRFLHSQLRYPWSPTTETFSCWALEKRCSLACLRWLVEEAGCPVDWEAAAEGAETVDLVVDVQQWLQAQIAAARAGQAGQGGPSGAVG